MCTKGEYGSKLLCVLMLALRIITVTVGLQQENQECYLLPFSSLVKTLCHWI